MIAGYLIWTRGLKGWIAEKWPASYVPPKDAPAPVARYPLNAEQYAMSIAILEQRFPPPRPPEETAPAPQPDPPPPAAPEQAVAVVEAAHA